MNRTPLLIIDIDGVACDHATGICKAVNLDFNLKSVPKDVTTWNHNFGPITFMEAVERYYPNTEFILSLPVHKGFKEFMNSINNNVLIKFATNRVHSNEATKTWIKTQLGSYEVLFVKDKNDLEFDYLIEDYTDTAIDAAKKGKTAFVISRPWNATNVEYFQNEPCLHYVKAFDEIISIICS